MDMFQNLVAVITGGAQGIGRGIALAYAKSGSQCCCCRYQLWARP